MKKYFNTNNTARTYINGEVSSVFFRRRCRTTHVITPKEIPSEMEYAKPIIQMATKQGTALMRLDHSIFATDCIIRKPTTISAGAVANAGTVKNNGDRNKDNRNRIPTVQEVIPVRPPSEMPEEDSTNVVMVEVPQHAPTTVPTASANKMPLICGSLPFSSSISTLDAQPMTVPNVSKTSTNKKENIITKKSSGCCAMKAKSNLKKVGAID